MATENGAPRPTHAPRRRIVQAALCLLALACLAAAGFAAFRTWRAAADESEAQRLGQTSAEQALAYATAGLRWRPDDADLWRQRANFAAFADPADARRYALRAVALNPQDWRAWQTLGLLDFQLGNLPASRRDLTAATRYDHGFDSHFALGNLALVQGNVQEFSKEMAAALAIAPVERVDFALRQILSHAKLSPAGLARLLPPERAEIVAQSIEIFLLSGNIAAAVQSWKRLRCQSYQRADCREAALALANGLVAAAFASHAPPPSDRRRPAPKAEPELPTPTEMVSSAMDVWNQAVRAGILAQSAVTSGTVADGQFRHAWVGPAFSWQSTHVLPLQAESGPAQQGNAVRIPFNGYQPDEAVLLREFVPVQPGATYSVSYRSRRQLAGSETGLELQILPGPDRQLAVVPAILSQSWSLNSATLTVPQGAHLLELAFAFSRPNGQVRMHDRASIADVSLEQLLK